MGFLGRESQRDIEKKERWKQWAQARPPLALFAMAAALLCVVDAPIMVLSFPAGITAIVLSIIGLRRFEQSEYKAGRGLYQLAIALAMVGMVLALIMWQVVWPWLAAKAGN